MVCDVFGIQMKSKCILVWIESSYIIMLTPNTRYSRNGLPIDTHPPIIPLLGQVVLDGEVWYTLCLLSFPFSSLIIPFLLFPFSFSLLHVIRCGRGHFVETNQLIQTSLEKLHWALFRYQLITVA
jgi:hypothetical protein